MVNEKKFRLGPRWALVLFSILLVAPSAILPKLIFDNAPEIYFPTQNPSVVFERELREHFPNDQFIYVLFSHRDIYSIEYLTKLSSAIKRIEAMPRVERVLSVVSSDYIRADELGFIVESLIDPLQLEKYSEQQRKDRVLGDRFAPDLLASRDGESVAVIIRPISLDQSLARLDLQSEVEKIIVDEALYDSLIGFAGPIPLDVAQFRSMLHDNMVFVPMTLAMALAIIYILFRSWQAVVVTVLVTSSVTPVVIALLVVFGRPYTLVASMIPPLILALTAAVLIHLFSGMRQGHLKGLVGRDAVQWSVNRVRRPAFFTALTTALGLGSLGASPIVPIRDYGLAAAAGAVLSYFVVMVLLPPMLSKWFGSRFDRQNLGMNFIDRIIASITRVSIRRALLVTIVFSVLGVCSVPLISKIKVETDMLRFFSPEHPLTIATQQIQNRIGGVTPMEIVIRSPELDGLQDPDLLKSLKELSVWLEGQPEVDRVVSMVDILEEINKAFHGGHLEFRSIPDRRNLISQYLLLYDGRDLYDLVNRDFTSARIVLSVNVHETKKLALLIEKIRARLPVIERLGVQARIAGFGLLLAEQEELLVKGQLRGLAIVIGTIFTVFLLLFRSFFSALLCLLPNVAPVIVTFAIMGLTNIWLDMATALIASLAMGIAVDDSIHFYSGYLREKKKHNYLKALVKAYREAGRAVLATTIVLMATFFILGWSEFRPIKYFGLLTAFALGGALVFDLMLLPALIVLAQRVNISRTVTIYKRNYSPPRE